MRNDRVRFGALLFHPRIHGGVAVRADCPLPRASFAIGRAPTLGFEQLRQAIDPAERPALTAARLEVSVQVHEVVEAERGALARIARRVRDDLRVAPRPVARRAEPEHGSNHHQDDDAQP